LVRLEAECVCVHMKGAFAPQSVPKLFPHFVRSVDFGMSAVSPLHPPRTDIVSWASHVGKMPIPEVGFL
jgi:hypothetical protein